MTNENGGGEGRPRLYASLEDFYAQRAGRRLSGESDFGVWWTGHSNFPKLRVSVIHDTGEVYSEQQVMGTGRVELLGDLGTDGCKMLDSQTRHSPGCPYVVAERVLAGWAEECPRPNSIAWVRARMIVGAADGPGAAQAIAALRRVEAEVRDLAVVLRILEADGEAEQLVSTADMIKVVREVRARRAGVAP